MTTSAAASTFARNETIKYLYTTTAMGTRPTGWVVKLHSADPTVDGSVGVITGSSYADQAVTFTQTGNQVANNNAITFPVVTTTPYTVSWYSVWDNNGNMLSRTQLAIPKTFAVGDAAAFAVGELIIINT